jgi:hypothetical protein
MTHLLKRSLLPWCISLAAVALLASGCDPASHGAEGCDGGCEAESSPDAVHSAADAAHAGSTDAAAGGAHDAAAPNDGGSARDAGSAHEDAGGAHDTGSPNADGGGTDASGTDAAGPDGAAHGKLCGGFAGLSCDDGEFCNYEPAAGGQGCDGTIADASGVCQGAEQGCTAAAAPVCGCDGSTYGNSCLAHAAGVSVRSQGACQPQVTSCDRRKLLCRRAEPVCPEGQVASIVGSCYGPCVKLEECSCSEAAACPMPEQYTCHMSAHHCGPYVD